LALEDRHYPPFMRYCIGLDRFVAAGTDHTQQLELVEAHLQRPECVGLKLYPGYNYFYVYDPVMDPFFELAAKYHKPVAGQRRITRSSNTAIPLPWTKRPRAIAMFSSSCATLAIRFSNRLLPFWKRIKT
jgi:predicted TIM-barrel fold metal-dependent hydrolase